MPLHYERDDTRKMIRITATGAAAPEEWVAGPQRQASEGCWGYALLFDLRRAVASDDCAPMLWDTTSLVQRLTKDHGQRGPVAIVSADPIAHATARMYTITTNAVLAAIQVFRSVEEAEAWLIAQRP